MCDINGCCGNGDGAWRGASETIDCRSKCRLGNEAYGWYVSFSATQFIISPRPQLTLCNTEEHHIGNFDPASFFTLHDFDDNGFWDRSEILRFYGIDVHNEWEEKEVSQEKKEEIIEKILGMIDGNRNNVVEKDEWMRFCEDGKTLPDFGLGPGHHWDMETEYEIHHWEK